MVPVEPKPSELARRACDALAALHKSLLAEQGLPRGAAAEYPLTVQWASGVDPERLLREARTGVEEAAAAHHDFQPGRVFCYNCTGARCEHAELPGPGHVFAGYSNTGVPRWEELFQFLLEVGDERTGRLFEERGDPMSRVIGRRRLTDEQLDSFGRNSLAYRIWGQVVAGYFRVEGMRAAMTVQVVETRDRALHLQVLTCDAVKHALAEAPAGKRSSFHRVFDALRRAREELEVESRLWQTVHGRMPVREMAPKVFSVLRHLALSIERKGRQQSRRTTHAESRASEKRPIHKAMEDLRGATDDDFRHDRVRDSIVVKGRAGRVHVFSRDGKHVTSLLLSAEELARRERRERYVPLDPEIAASVRAAASGSAGKA